MTTKKNWMVRAIVLMLALVLITSCFVGGTFAKYVTSGSGTDTARVAKFGVTVGVEDNTMFKTEYATDDDNAKAKIVYSVVTDPNGDQKKLVAPGTKEDGTLTFSVTGKPEVAVNVNLVLDVQSDVFLKAGTYKDYTNTAENFTLAEEYTPVVFTLKKGETVVEEGTLAVIAEKLKELSGDCEANTDLNDKFGTYTLSWAWAFDGNDQADTLLGNLAAGTAEGIDKGNYSTDIDFTFTATVTQID